MNNNLYLIHEDDYLSHIDDKVRLYSMLKQLTFLIGKNHDPRAVRELAGRFQKVNEELDKDIKVYLTRDSDVYPDNNSRARTANQIADMMVSIHMNAAENTLVNGTETLYKNHDNDTGETLTSKQLAELIQSSIIEATGNNNRGTVHRTDLLILNGTTVPSVIVEVVFLSNVGDALKISQDAYQDIVAEAIAEAIEEAFDEYDVR